MNENRLQDNPSVKQIGEPMPPPASLLGKRVAQKQITIEFDPNSITNPSGNDDNDFLPADKLEAKSARPVA